MEKNNYSGHYFALFLYELSKSAHVSSEEATQIFFSKVMMFI